MEVESTPKPSASIDELQWAKMEELRIAHQSNLALPSWVPDWSQPYDQRHQLLFRENTYHASKGTAAKVTVINGDPTSIRVSGIPIDTIAVVHSSAYDSSAHNIWNSLHALEHTASVAASILIDDDAVRELALADEFWRTLVANSTRAGAVPAPES
jgi:hypothetical protein